MKKSLLSRARVSLQVAALITFYSVLPSALAQGSGKAGPANQDELKTYGAMSAVTFCEARGQEVDYKKAASIAAVGEITILVQKHGSMIEGIDKPLTNKQLIPRVQFNAVARAIAICPKLVPEAQKKEIKNQIRKIQESLAK
jgi:hypothetical protein